MLSLSSLLLLLMLGSVFLLCIFVISGVCILKCSKTSHVHTSAAGKKNAVIQWNNSKILVIFSQIHNAWEINFFFTRISSNFNRHCSWIPTICVYGLTTCFIFSVHSIVSCIADFHWMMHCNTHSHTYSKWNSEQRIHSLILTSEWHITWIYYLNYNFPLCVYGFVQHWLWIVINYSIYYVYIWSTCFVRCVYYSSGSKYVLLTWYTWIFIYVWTRYEADFIKQKR